MELMAIILFVILAIPAFVIYIAISAVGKLFSKVVVRVKVD